MNLLLVRLRFLQFRVLWTVVGVTTLSTTASVLVTAWWLHRPPVVVQSFSEDDGLARIGEDLVLRTTKSTNEICRTRVARFLWQWDPRDPRPEPALDDAQAFAKKWTIWRELHSAPDSPPIFVAQATYELRVPILKEDNIEPGLWHYLGEASDDCGNNKPRLSLPIKPIQIGAETRDVVVPERTQ